MRVGALAVYPVKGATAVALDHCEIDALGPVGDRRYRLVRPGGRVYTQRDDPNLARLRALTRGEGLRLSFDGEDVDIDPDAAAGKVDTVLARWFGTALTLERLRQPRQREGAALAFGDAAALLLTNEASLDALNAALAAPLPMDRFRPNLVVSGAPAYAEDQWGRLRIGEVLLAPVHPCGRCEVTTIDQEFGARLGDEPLRTLARLRMREGEAIFGVRYSVERPGRVRIGDAIESIG